MSFRPLTILMVDKYYFLKGGAERYMFELSDLLEARGHRVIPFSMNHPDNKSTPWSRFFPSHIDLVGESKASSLWGGIRYTARAIYSREAKKRLAELIREVKPDVAHLHMIDHQLSPSILDALRRAKVPSVQTVHQYKAVCPNYRLYNEKSGEICELCVRGSAWNALRTRCHKGSLVASASVAVETSIHRALGLNKRFDLWHTPSEFMASKLREGGYPSEKIVTFPYTIDVRAYPFFPEASHEIVYCGRLSHEKGLHTLLSALAKTPERKLRIIGGGPLREELEKRVKDEGLDNVQFAGWLSGEELQKALGSAALQIVPSEWYENSPLSIYESLSMGTPVLGAIRGGVPELIPEGTGGLFEAGDSEGLAREIRRLFENPEVLHAMRQKVRDHALREFDFPVHQERIEACYHRLIQGSSTPGQPSSEGRQDSEEAKDRSESGPTTFQLQVASHASPSSPSSQGDPR